DVFVGVPFSGAGRAVGSVIAQAGRGLQKFLGGGAAFHKMLDGGFGRAISIGGLDRFGSLDFGFARGNVFDDGGVDGNDVTTGDGRGFHYAVGDVLADEIFGGSDVLHTFGDGPAIGTGLEIPLGGGEALGGVEDVLFGGFEVFEGFVFFGLGEFLGADGECGQECDGQDEDDGARFAHGGGSLPFLKCGQRGSNVAGIGGKRKKRHAQRSQRAQRTQRRETRKKVNS